ncbi:SGS-domain-containing protein [Dothidotthia symphoricarpi CBS 119687]|uniref:SGS-domain-containing protein n=1 Tax=Dothidotthia symphoricarpi CBS 119687 TaxID=1392245 RepID=A0A6A6A3W6_9PLEO|nr:SGS-domain-containing protein [Dothidotthia symphoricarpi CBS 119687]KAF2125281.1 SGS-domain-containing protein [Dothidotthia symphoricarpi CBS 119687]
MDEARKGDAALSASNYEEAIQHLTNALSSNPTAVKYYISRSTAYQRSSKYAEALADAEVAVVLAHKRAVRELIKDAQFRRAIALYFLGNYADAEHLLNTVKKLDDKEKMLPIWTMKVAAKLKDIPEGDERRQVTIKDIPDVNVPTASSTAKSAPAKSQDSESKTADTPVAPKAVVPTPADKIKHDWYQNNDNIVFSILAKGVPKDEATVEILKDSLSVTFPIGDTKSEWSFSADPLFASIDPAQSMYRVTPNKVEVTLRKAKPGLKWHDIEGDREVEVEDDKKSAIPSHVLSGKSNQESPPVYPTSSKSGVKNWDKVVMDDLGDKDDMEGDETSAFFKKLYAGAGAEQQRAMLKSYQESGGTVLSTDWGNVGSRTVVPEPPEGMEAKKY